MQCGQPASRVRPPGRGSGVASTAYCPNVLPGQLVTVGGADHNVALQSGVGDLAANVRIGASHDHPVLRGVVLVLVLHHQTLPGEEVGLALPPPAELDLEPLEVSLVLDHLDERHLVLQAF